MESFAEVHKEQLAALGFPTALVPALYSKLANETFDSGGTFQVMEDEETGTRFVSCLRDLEAEADVFLVDHAWTFDVETYRKELQQRPDLLQRMAAMMGCRQIDQAPPEDEAIDGDGDDEEDGGGGAEGGEEVDEESLPRATADRTRAVYEQVCEEVWRYAQPYRLVDPQDPFRFKTVWFVMDELGSALSHSDRPSFQVSPFVFMPHGALRSAISYSLMWPVRRVEEGELCTRDLAAGVHSQRLARLALWFRMPHRVMHSFRRKHEARLARREEHVTSQEQAQQQHHHHHHHKQQHHHHQHDNKSTSSSSSSSASAASIVPPPPPALAKKKDHFTIRFLDRVRSGGTLRIYSDNAQITKYLTRPEFVHVSSPAEADICWIYHSTITDTYREENGVSQGAVLGQSPGDECLVFKHLLPATAARAHQHHGPFPWIPQTFNLETEAAEVVWELERRKAQGQERWFILKPWNMGRSMDSVVTDSLPQVLRYIETGPKVCCEYVARPALVYGRKMDVRVRVVVRSWQPLELVRWTHVGPRLANHPYTLDMQELGDFQTHFTVMEYAGHEADVPSEVDFKAAFEKENGQPWSVVDAKIDTMLKSLFSAAADIMAEKQGTEGLDRCASIYGVDVIVTAGTLEPRLLEVTFAPDCKRALQEDPDFYNKAFGAMFLDESVDFQLL